MFMVDYSPPAGRLPILHAVSQRWAAGGWSSSPAGQQHCCRVSLLEAPGRIQGCSPAPSSSFSVKEMERRRTGRDKVKHVQLNFFQTDAVNRVWCGTEQITEVEHLN